MDKLLIVDSLRPWVERTTIKPGDRVIAHHVHTGCDYKVTHDGQHWIVENHEALRRTDFINLLDVFRAGWKFYKLVSDDQKMPYTTRLIQERTTNWSAWIDEVIDLSEDELSQRIAEIRKRIKERIGRTVDAHDNG
jgi:hypothetical protein